MENIKQISKIEIVLPYDMPPDTFLDYIDKSKISIKKFTSENREVIYMVDKKDDHLPMENNKR